MAGERDNCTRRMGTRLRPRRRRRPVHGRMAFKEVPMPFCGARAKRASVSSVHARHGDGVVGERMQAAGSPTTAPCRPHRAPGRHAFFRRQGNGSHQCEQQGKTFHVERARGKLRRNLHDGPSSGLSEIRIME